MKKLKLTVIMLICCCLLFSTPCLAATKQIKLKATVAYTIQKGEKLKLYIKGHKNNKKVHWKSSNSKIASVSQKGVVTGKKGGTCRITATINKKKYKAEIFVIKGERVIYDYDVSPEETVNRYDIDVTKINKEKKILYVGQTFSLKVTGTKKKIKWESSNSDIADVSSDGKVTAKLEGTATITASFEDDLYVYEHTCKITVNPLFMDSDSIEETYGVFFTEYNNTIHITGNNSNSLSGIVKSALITDIPEIMEADVIYGDDIHYKYDGTDILFNLSDLDSLGILG